jgi:hypothetical protein
MAAAGAVLERGASRVVCGCRRCVISHGLIAASVDHVSPPLCDRRRDVAIQLLSYRQLYLHAGAISQSRAYGGWVVVTFMALTVVRCRGGARWRLTGDHLAQGRQQRGPPLLNYLRMYLARYLLFLDALLGSVAEGSKQNRSWHSVPNTPKLSETEGRLLTDETVHFTGIQTRP